MFLPDFRIEKCIDLLAVLWYNHTRKVGATCAIFICLAGRYAN